jgi:outer membrane usher protein FimD/PapC
MSSKFSFIMYIMAGLFACGQAAGDSENPPQLSGVDDGRYTLSYAKDRWTDDFSVFQMHLAAPSGSFNAGIAASDDPQLHPLTRLDTSLDFSAPIIDSPARLGDAVSSSGFWDEPVRMGGLQIGTIQPALPAVVAPSTTLLPDALGAPLTATPGLGSLPSNYIAAASSRFISDVRTDEQLQTQTLVGKGDSGYSLEMGRIREDFEFRSNDYGAWMTSGTYRYGLGEDTTVDGQFAQLGAEQSVVGLGVLEGLGSLGQVSARVANSRDSDAGSGWLARFGYDYSRENLSVALRTHMQSGSYQPVNDIAAVEPVRQRTLASAAWDFGGLGKLSLASATHTFADDSRRDVVALSHSMPIAGGGLLSASAAYSPGPNSSSALLLSLRFPFDYWLMPWRKFNQDMDDGLDRAIGNALNVSRGAQPPGLVSSFNNK